MQTQASQVRPACGSHKIYSRSEIKSHMQDFATKIPSGENGGANSCSASCEFLLELTRALYMRFLETPRKWQTKSTYSLVHAVTGSAKARASNTSGLQESQVNWCHNNNQVRRARLDHMQLQRPRCFKQLKPCKHLPPRPPHPCFGATICCHRPPSRPRRLAQSS